MDLLALKTLIVKRRKTLAVLIPACILLFAIYGLVFAGQTFSSYASLSMQQNLPSGGALGGLSLLSGNSSGSRYLGVLRSRYFAEQVENVVRIQRKYNKKNFEDAVTMLQSFVKIEDSITDSLLIIHVDVPGPARFARNSEGKRAEAKALSAKIANVYVVKFQKYLKETDNDRDAVLYREAEKRLKKADDDYRESVRKFVSFAKGLKGAAGMPTGAAMPIEDAGASASGGSGSAVGGSSGGLAQSSGASELGALYIRQGALEAQIKAGEVVQEKTNIRLNATPEQLAKFDDDDPLLQQARRDVTDAQIAYDKLRIAFADSNPRVQVAAKTLAAARKRLVDQAQSIQQQNTTEATKLSGQKAELDVITRQIDEAMKRFKVSKDAMTDLEALKGDLTLDLEVLKATSTGFAQLALQNVSGQSRTVLIDKGLEPPFGKPGIMIILIMSIVGALVVSALLLSVDYILTMMRLADIPEYATENVA